MSASMYAQRLLLAIQTLPGMIAQAKRMTEADEQLCLLLLMLKYLSSQLIHLTLGKMSIPKLPLPLQVQGQIFALAKACELIIFIVPVRVVASQALSRVQSSTACF